MTHELGVLARDRDVVEEDVGVGMPTDDGDVGVEQESRAAVGTAAHDEQRGTRRQRRDRLLLLGGDVGFDRTELGGRITAEPDRRVAGVVADRVLEVGVDNPSPVSLVPSGLVMSESATANLLAPAYRIGSRLPPAEYGSPERSRSRR